MPFKRKARVPVGRVARTTKTTKTTRFRKRRGFRRQRLSLRVYPWVRRADLNNEVSTNIVGNTGGGNGQSLTFDGTDGVYIINTGAGGVTGVTYYSLGINFTFDMLPNHTEFSSLFDQYKIKYVYVKLQPFNTSSVWAATAGGATVGVWCHSVIDMDDSTPVSADNAGINVLREYPGYIAARMTASGFVHRRLKPRVAEAVFSGAGGGGPVMNVVARPPWINFSGNGEAVPHYGLKVILQVTATPGQAAIIYLKPEVKMAFACRNVR